MVANHLLVKHLRKFLINATTRDHLGLHSDYAEVSEHKVHASRSIFLLVWDPQSNSRILNCMKFAEI